MPTARRMRDLGVVERDIERLVPLDATPRPLTAYELVGAAAPTGNRTLRRIPPPAIFAALDAEVARRRARPARPGRSPDERSARDDGARSA